MNNYTKITMQDIEIAESFFENDRHLDEFLANVCRYYSGKTITIKTKIVAKYFETYKKTMDNVIKARDFGKNGGTKRVENQSNVNDTLEGCIEDTPQPKLIEVNINKDKEINIKEILENQINEIYEIYPTKCPVKNRSTGKNAKNRKQIESLIKKNSFENIKTRVTNYVNESEKDKVWIKNFSSILNELPELEDQTKKPITSETMVVFTNDDDIDPNREHKAYKRVYDEYLSQGKPIKFIRYVGI